MRSEKRGLIISFQYFVLANRTRCWLGDCDWIRFNPRTLQCPCAGIFSVRSGHRNGHLWRSRF